MPTSTANKYGRWALNSLIVIVAFLIVDLLFHIFWPTSVPYMDNFLEKLLYTTVFAAIYAHIYDKASQEFHMGSNKIFNGLIFSILFCVAILMAVGLMLWLGSTIYIYLLHGFHGAPPPPEERELLLTGTQIIVAGSSLSTVGKTEGTPR